MVSEFERISTLELDVKALCCFIVCFFGSCGGGLDFVKSIDALPWLGLTSGLKSGLGESMVTFGRLAAGSMLRGILVLATGAISVVKSPVGILDTYRYN